MRRSKLNAFTAMLGFLLSVSCYAAHYSYHSQAGLFLGGGFDPRNPARAFGQCLQQQNAQRVNEGAATTQVSIRIVRSESDIHQAVGFSTQISGTLLFANSHLSSNYSESSSFSTDSVTYVIVAKTDYGMEYIPNPTLKDEYGNRQADQLKGYCGPEIVTQQTKGAALFGVFTLSNLSQQQQREFVMSFGVGAGLPFASNEVKSQYQRFITEIAAVSQMSMNVYAIGGQGLVQFAALLNQGGNLAERIANAPRVMGEYMATINFNNAVSTSYTTMEIEQFVGQQAPNLNDINNIRLTRVYDSYVWITNIVARLERILIQGDATYQTPTPKEREALRQNLRTYARARHQIEDEGRNCFVPAQDRHECRITDILLDLPEIKWPQRTVTVPPASIETQDQRREKEEEEQRKKEEETRRIAREEAEKIATANKAKQLENDRRQQAKQRFDDMLRMVDNNMSKIGGAFMRDALVGSIIGRRAELEERAYQDIVAGRSTTNWQ